MALTIEGYTYIQHKVKQRPWGPECQFTVARPDGTHINEVISIPSMEISNQELVSLVSKFLLRKKTAADIKAKRSTVFAALDTNKKIALKWLVRNIRKYPNATYVQAETAWNAEFGSNLFTFAKLSNYILMHAGNITWDQFKTFVINHTFTEIE